MNDNFTNHQLTKEFQILYSSVKKFVKEVLEPISYKVEIDEKIPDEIVETLRNLGLFGMPVPKKYGGLGLSTFEEMLIYEELTQTNGCYRSRIGTSNGIGSMGIVYDGTEAQKKFYLPQVASGKWSTAFALTEPNAGSDAANICTSAVLKDDHWIMNGNKIFITNADVAHLFTVIAVTDEKKGARGGVSAFIVEKGMPGFSIGSPDVKMGLKGSHTYELLFKDCIVPSENVIGGMENIGNGFRTAMKVLDKGRLSMGACALGASKKIMDLCRKHLKKKIKSGIPLISLQSNQFALADMAIQIYAAEQMLYNAAINRDEGKNVTQKASMVKVFCTEIASKIADFALDILEEDGCLSKNLVEILLRDVRLYRIYEGTSEIQRLIIARNLLK